jgi:peptidoglycan/xylan/chitin deacetylase (PgdA/CDA1 family)
MTLLTPGTRVRRHVRRLVAGSFHAADRLLRAGQPRREARVLYYHRIADEPHRACVSPRDFHDQMRYLRDQGHAVVSLREIALALERGDDPAPGTVAVTFDDGFADSYTAAFPTLSSLAIPATIFVVVGAIGSRLHVLRDRPAGVSALTWEQIRAMPRDLVTVGSHTVTHPNLTRLSPGALDDELGQSRDVIARETGVVPDLFCYPRGDFDDTVRRAVRRAGYRLACTTRPGGVSATTDPLALPRTFVAHDDRLEDFARKLDGAFDYLHHGVAFLRRHLPRAAEG